MRGVQGLTIAAAFGIVGAFCNWLYINKLADDYEKISFVAISTGAQINLGDRFKPEHFERVDIPKNNVGNLDKVAIFWRDRNTVFGSATRSYRGGEILLRHDLTTPGRKDLSEMLAENEVARWVPVSSGDFVPEMVNPGNLVSFIVPRLPGGQPAKVSSSKALLAQPTEVIGPFPILALGTRTGKPEVRRAAGRSSGPEHIITIAVRLEGGRMEPRAERLFDVLRLIGNKGAQVMLHSSKAKE